MNTQIVVKDKIVTVKRIGNEEYISLTDLARYVSENDPSSVIRNWMSNKNSFAFYSLWEELNNQNFNSVESHGIKINEVPYNRFTMTPRRWKIEFNAIGIIPSSGKYSNGTFAHSDIAFEFASWLSPEFKMYLIKEFQRLKKEENYNAKNEWHANRLLTKVNYLVHTNAVKNIIVPTLSEQQKNFIYEEEADILNVALFGITAKEWRNNNPDLVMTGNMRDYTDLLHLIILSNLENINAELIEMGISQSNRLIRLNSIARKQIELFQKNKSLKSLEYNEKNL